MTVENSQSTKNQNLGTESVRLEPSSYFTPSLVLLAVGWGPKLGGINAFNTDFAKALGETLRPHRVVCVVLDADKSEIADAAAANVTLLPLGKNKEEFDDLYAEAVQSLLGKSGIQVDASTIWLGHDVHTGPVALRLAEISGQGRSVVIQHMSYGDYIGFRDGKGEKAHDKQQIQEALYRKADVVFAVGPLLCERLSRIVHDQGKTAHMIVPGLAEITPNDAPHEDFRAIAMGRLGPGDDRIKQGRLALAAFSSAIRKAHEDPAWPENLKYGEMFLYGIEEAGGEEEQELRQLAEAEAGRAIKLTPLKFTHDRARLFHDLASCDAALMLSWHEGFGLTGWEAIAAGVPLIASRNSGLFKLLEKDEALGVAAIALFKHLDVRGSGTSETDKNYRTEDKDDVRSALLELARDTKKARNNALKLRKMLIDRDFTWSGAAVEFLKNLGTNNPSAPKNEKGEAPKIAKIGGSAGPQNSAQPTNFATAEEKPGLPPSEEAKKRSQELAAQLTRLFGLDELLTITDTFIEHHKESYPDLVLDRGNLANYLLSEENEDRRYENVAEFLVIILDQETGQTNQSSQYKLFGFLLQTLVRQCAGTQDQGLTNLPFRNRQTAELVAAHRTLYPHVPVNCPEHVNSKRDKHFTNIGVFLPEDGVLTIEEKCQNIAAELLAEWFGYSRSPEALPLDRLHWLADLLEPLHKRKPENRPFHGLYVNCKDVGNPVLIPEIAEKLHEVFGEMLWIYQYGEYDEAKSKSLWLYTSEAKIESWIRQYESSLTDK